MNGRVLYQEGNIDKLGKDQFAVRIDEVYRASRDRMAHYTHAQHPRDTCAALPPIISLSRYKIAPPFMAYRVLAKWTDRSFLDFDDQPSAIELQQNGFGSVERSGLVDRRSGDVLEDRLDCIPGTGLARIAFGSEHRSPLYVNLATYSLLDQELVRRVAYPR
jgi:hypothetical protein